ncbi:GMC oxidoreductase [Auriscalpium vulgare]|uniref:GMC oxidoreductase n=1 Tax=Auriscalpium vulgare TaxID=40419 RepID=A0ACB8S714_9AGAM|nr:GMC oxidoreductase [Auriscalpium vulgare]
MIVKDLTKVGTAVKENGKTTADGAFDEYDVVIVGGGTAGCVLASRLTEDPSLRVLLLEAGDSSLKVVQSQIPSAYHMLFGGDKIYNLFTTPQVHLTDDKKVYWPRGACCSGSAVNAQIFHYGSPSDYDEWARLGGVGAQSWAYKNLKKYFLKFENFTPSKLHPGVDASLRGALGPVNVGFHGNHSVISESFIEACANVGIPRTSDLNTAHGTNGVAKVMTYINEKGRRVTTESAYLTPDVLARPNLIIGVNAQVTRVLFDTSDGGEPRANGVEFSDSRNRDVRALFRAKAKREVIMSYILLLSGIGPAAQLTEHNVPVVLDSPGVGAHLMDHPVVDTAFAEKEKNSYNFLIWPYGIWEWFRLFGAVLQYLVTGKGPLTTNVAEAAAFFRSKDEKLFPPGKEGLTPEPEEVASAPDAPDLEFFVSPMGFLEQGKGSLPPYNSLGLHMTLLRPTSLGSITLKSADPFDPPVIDPNYLATENDIAVLERGMDVLSRVAHAPPLANIIDHTNKDPRLGHRLTGASREEIRAYIRKHLQTLFHPTCTARMAPQADGGVVDADLRVYGVRGLRVVDASVFPRIVSGHTAAPTIAVAEKAADMIKETCTLLQNPEGDSGAIGGTAHRRAAHRRAES